MRLVNIDLQLFVLNQFPYNSVCPWYTHYRRASFHLYFEALNTVISTHISGYLAFCNIFYKGTFSRGVGESRNVPLFWLGTPR